MKGRNAIAVLLGVVALALLGGQGAAAAGSAGDPFAAYDQERFRVTIKGFQKMVDQNSHPGGEDECDASDFSSGSERVFFRSTKPIVVRAIDIPSYRNPYLVTGRTSPVLPTRATVKRSFTPRIGPTPAWCGGTGGGQQIPPDCGTRTITPWRIGISYSFDRARRILASSKWIADGYRNCRGNAGAFPYLLDESGPSRRPVFAEIPKHEIFDPSIGKIITIARGHYRHRIPGYFYDTTVRWELTFERIRPGR
jgi:hypothetical protein